jgi:hypothetical protein
MMAAPFLAGHAAAHTNLHLWLLEVLDAAQIAEHFFLRLFAYRTGVEQNQVGFVDRVLCGFVAVCCVQHIAILSESYSFIWQPKVLIKTF